MFRIEYRPQSYFFTISGSRGLYHSNVAIYEDSSFDLLQKSYKKRLIVNPLDKILFTNCIEVKKYQRNRSIIQILSPFQGSRKLLHYILQSCHPFRIALEYVSLTTP